MGTGYVAKRIGESIAATIEAADVRHWYTPEQVRVLSAVFATQDMAMARYGRVVYQAPRYPYQGSPYDSGNPDGHGVSLNPVDPDCFP